MILNILLRYLAHYPRLCKYFQVAAYKFFKCNYYGAYIPLQI